MNQKKHWVAIGDSFTYLDAHQSLWTDRFEKGYVTRTKEKLPFPCDVTNLGVDGAIVDTFVSVAFPQADFYTILLGTNDWNSELYPIGDKADFLARKPQTFVGHLGIIIDHIREVSPKAVIFVMNPVERAHFVYARDQFHDALDSTHRKKFGYLRDYASAIMTSIEGENVVTVDAHRLTGITVGNAVRFMRVLTKEGTIRDLVYPEYCEWTYDPHGPYPYPKEAWDMTYDGLHPSDKGAERIAEVLADSIVKNVHSI